MDYVALDFSRLRGIDGFSDKLLENHLKLYQGYINNVNQLSQAIAETTSPILQAEARRRFGWEFNGMRLHELYFRNLEPGGEDVPQILQDHMGKVFGSFDHWKADFLAAASARGAGWVILYQDPSTGNLFNTWVTEHDMGHLSGCKPLLVLDLWEHAYITDYGLGRADYIDAFISNINWNIVSGRMRSTV